MHLAPVAKVVALKAGIESFWLRRWIMPRRGTIKPRPGHKPNQTKLFSLAERVQLPLQEQVQVPELFLTHALGNASGINLQTVSRAS